MLNPQLLHLTGQPSYTWTHPAVLSWDYPYSSSDNYVRELFFTLTETENVSPKLILNETKADQDKSNLQSHSKFLIHEENVHACHFWDKCTYILHPLNIKQNP